MRSLAAVQVEHVTKTYGSIVALQGIDLRVEAGEIVALLGPNGAGKTTLVSIVAGLRRPDSGSASLFGIDVLRRPAEARRLVGYAAQELAIYVNATVVENLRLFADLVHVPRGQVLQRIDEVAAALGLTGLMSRKAGTMSGGEKRRLHTAIAMLSMPPVLLLDEPTVGADVSTRSGILDIVQRLAAEGTAVCYSTHYLAEVDELRPTLAVLHRGRLLECCDYSRIVDAARQSIVEVHFDGPVPAIAFEGNVISATPSSVTIAAESPARTVAELYRSLGGREELVAGLSYGRPGLEAWYRTLVAEADERRPATEEVERAPS